MAYEVEEAGPSAGHQRMAVRRRGEDTLTAARLIEGEDLLWLRLLEQITPFKTPQIPVIKARLLWM